MPLQDLKSRRILDAQAVRDGLIESGVTLVTVSSVPYEFGTDAKSRENILAVISAISAGIPVPNPRPWTPKGSILPVMCSHDDLKAIGAALLTKTDALYQKYFTHKAAIAVLTTAADVMAYNVNTGWD
jgi:hypothetical protein